MTTGLKDFWKGKENGKENPQTRTNATAFSLGKEIVGIKYGSRIARSTI